MNECSESANILMNECSEFVDVNCYVLHDIMFSLLPNTCSGMHNSCVITGEPLYRCDKGDLRRYTSP